MLATDLSLRITEIFSSLQGESSYIGQPTTFIRLTGCPLRCVYCDSAYAFSGGEQITLSKILSLVKEKANRYVCVTGGEPLAQTESIALLERLSDAGYKVSLETSGALNISRVDRRVKKVVDIKTPSSEESSKNLWSNVDYLADSDELKFVIANREDFDWSIAQVKERGLCALVEHVFFSPVFSLPKTPGARVESSVQQSLANWVLESGLDIRYQLQMHKLIWGDKPGF